MKKRFIALCVALSCTVLTAQPTLSSRPEIVSVQRQAGERTGNSREWLKVETLRDSSGKTVTKTNTACVELATGMSYWDGQQWILSDPTFEETTDEFTATRTQHKVQLSGNINQEVAVVLTTPDGKVLRSTPIGIGLYDTASGRSLIIGEITDSQGVLVGSNRVVYFDAFKGVCADVVYTITQHSFEQDVVITGRINPADYNFPTNTTLVEIFTEFHGDVPEPEITRRPIKVEKDKSVRDRMVSPDLVDEILAFGEMVFPTGRAANYATLVSDPSASAVPVAKMYLTTPDRRTVLVESVQYSWVANDLMALPECQRQPLALPEASLKGVRREGYAQLPSRIRPTSETARVRSPRPELTAAMLDKRLGFAVDYIATIGAGPAVFRGDTTYLVTGPVVCNASATIEGGAVIKYKYLSPTSGPSITFNSSVICKTSRYRPAFFTGVDDNGLGESLNGYFNSGYNGGIINTNGYANPAILLSYYYNGHQLSNLRFSHCQTAVLVQGGNYTQATINHSQWVDCIRGIVITGGGCTGGGCAPISITGDNLLFSRVDYPLQAFFFTSGTFRQCTVDQAERLVTTGGGYSSTWNITNSIIANIPQLYDSSSSPISFLGSNNGVYQCGFSAPGMSPVVASGPPFQASGASAGYYLAPGHSFRNVGTTNGFPAALLKEMKVRAVDPPMFLSGSLTSDTVLSPIIAGDWDNPDLGYHYPRLDYVLNNVTLSALLKLENGVAIGLQGSPGLSLQTGASIYSVGTPLNLNQFVTVANVHEQCVSPSDSTLMTLSSGTGSSTLDFRFTDFSVGQGRLGTLVSSSGNPFSRVSFKDSAFHQSEITLYPGSSSPTMVSFTNNLLEGCKVSIGQSSAGWTTPFEVNLYNNLMVGNPGTLPALALNFDVSHYWSDWQIRDNLFDKAAQTIAPNNPVPALVHLSNNGFVATARGLVGTSDKTGFSVTYQTGSLGTYYLPSTASQLFNQGSRTAVDAGLYHYTVRTSNLKEGADNSTPLGQVDIGFHYVSLNSGGNPVDTDGDGLADYFEDSNGNGSYNPGDIANWNLSDTDGDGVWDGPEVRQGRDPQVGAGPDNAGMINLRVFTLSN